MNPDKIITFAAEINHLSPPSSVRFLSSIMAIIVLALATLPCCLEDDCICASGERLYCEDCCCGCGDCGCDDCGGSDAPCGCCSPFVSCNTCTGFTAPRVFMIPNRTFIVDDFTLSDYSDKAVKGFDGSVWQPPRGC